MLDTFRALIVAVPALTLIALTGCADIPQVIAGATELRDRAESTRPSLVGELTRLEEARAATPDTSPDAIPLDAAVAKARLRLAALDAAILHADEIIGGMTEPTDTLTQGVGALAPVLPPHARGPVLLGAALLATLFRARQTRRGASSIAVSIQNALKDPEFRGAFERHADAIRSIQTPAARRIVDEATKPGPMLRCPI